MMNKNVDYMNIPQEQFEFVNHGERISDKKFEDKPIGYFKDAWIRFRKNKASIVAAIIILLIVLFAFAAPLLTTNFTDTFMDVFYAKKPPRNLTLMNIGIADGGTDRDFSDKGLIKAIGIGMAAEDRDGAGDVTLEEGMVSYYQPMIEIGNSYEITEIKGAKPKTIFEGRIDNYLEVGFLYRSIEQSEYHKIVAWEEETGLQVLYPLVAENEWNIDSSDANNWYKTKKGAPIYLNENGKAKEIAYGPGMVLEDNYKRDGEGNPLYYEYTGGGTTETAQYKVRVLYYNYYRYLNGFEPEYLMGTDSQGYDLSLRMAGGIRLSLLLAVCVSIINLTLGAIYGAIEGYYGGAADMIMERISDILNGVPFIVVATLFQIHLANKVGAIPCLLFAFVLTGWIGTAARTRTQFYRFKGQEYVIAARTLGAKDRRIIWKHIFPNSLGTIITASILVIPGVINSESMLSYLGIVKLSTIDFTSLGNLLADANGIWTNYPHLLLFPALILSLLMICFNLFGNGLRDAFNPSLRGVEE
ncbi:MAG: ABC transporter permease [Oscillospiraceae bacterium]|nr:ABC transporter permease [Oscillospiraceae bacterium]